VIYQNHKIFCVCDFLINRSAPRRERRVVRLGRL